MALEEDEITSWLVDYLGSDSTLVGMLNGEVYPDAAPESAAAPFVRLDRLDAKDLMVIGLHRVWADTVYHVRGVERWDAGGAPDRSDVNAIGSRIDALLHDHEAVTSVVHIHSFREEGEPQPSVVEPGGRLWLQSGGIYRVRASQI